MKKLTILLILIICTSTYLSIGIIQAQQDNTNIHTINILIYNGNGVSTNCVNGIKTSLDTINNKDLIPGYKFTYQTSTNIKSTILNNFDVLIMPGGTSGIQYINTIQKTTITEYVSAGHGYVGICAGAYSGSANVDGLYPGWGVAPHIQCKPITHEGPQEITLTPDGSKLLGIKSIAPLAHYNGPAMYSTNNNLTTIFATYTDNTTGYQGYSAIIGEPYGKGRTLLCGPHPELNLINPLLLAKMIIWTTNIRTSHQQPTLIKL